MTPQIKTGLTHFGTAMGGAVAALSFASSHSVDIYAIVNAMNDVVAAITKFIAIVTPFATAAYGVYRSTTKVRLAEIIQDPKAPEAARELPNSLKATDLANALKA